MLIPDHVPCKLCPILARCQSIPLWDLITRCSIFKEFVMDSDTPIRYYPWQSRLQNVVDGDPPSSIKGIPIHNSLPGRSKSVYLQPM